ncbi:hypothetical protein [Pseudomonas congelans]|uniref:hypothetical protein n=1 Tax=Pseudomonas congelans TaxID=200452 RepID=UPI001304552F|nr:hypothetical protein [Pseudomonas congelans]
MCHDEWREVQKEISRHLPRQAPALKPETNALFAVLIQWRRAASSLINSARIVHNVATTRYPLQAFDRSYNFLRRQAPRPAARSNASNAGTMREQTPPSTRKITCTESAPYALKAAIDTPQALESNGNLPNQSAWPDILN